jgi:hypothetical protein
MQVERLYLYNSGARVRNTYETYLIDGDSLWKRRLIPDGIFEGHPLDIKDLSL